MGRKLKLCTAALISLTPFRVVRVILLRVVFRYRISFSAAIGFGTILAVDEARVGSARIGAFSRFVGPFSLTVEDGVIVSPFNVIECVHGINGEKYRGSSFLRSCIVRKNARITAGHYIDATGGFELGENSWIAGQGSQFWTHGGDYRLDTYRSIVIGHDSYIGSAVRFVPGAGVGNHCVVGVGSVVTKRFLQDYVALAGVPAAVVKENFDWKTHGPTVD